MLAVLAGTGMGSWGFGGALRTVREAASLQVVRVSLGRGAVG